MQTVLLSWSGGKDSALALQALTTDPQYHVVGLVTAVTTDYDRISIHGVRRQLLEAQAASIGLPLHVISLSPGCSNDEYERAFHAGLGAARTAHPDCRHIAFGDLFLEDVRAYRERLLAGTDWTPVFPLWGENTRALARRFVDDGFDARLVCVDTTQLDGTFAGRAFDLALLGDLPSSAIRAANAENSTLSYPRAPASAKPSPMSPATAYSATTASCIATS